MPDSCYSSDICSTADYSGRESANSPHYYYNQSKINENYKRKNRSSSRNANRLFDDNESDLTSDSINHYTNSIRRQKSLPPDVRKSYREKLKEFVYFDKFKIFYKITS